MVWSSKKRPHHGFSILCVVIYKLVGEINAWGWEEYGSQLRIWEATHFWKTCFWLLGQVNAWKGIPKPIIHPCVRFLTQLEIAGAFSLTFLLFSSFFPWLGIRLGNAQWLGSSLGVFVVVSSSPGLGNPVFVLLSEYAAVIHVLGVSRGRFWSSSHN